MFFVYIIYSERFSKFYVGLSSDVERRISGHNSGNTKSTKNYAPWKVVHVEEFDTRPEARKRELYLKSAAGRRWRKKHINTGD
nr:GIY-YIG nuclease family protein [Allomuricauda sp.]